MIALIGEMIIIPSLPLRSEYKHLTLCLTISGWGEISSYGRFSHCGKRIRFFCKSFSKKSISSIRIWAVLK